MRASKSMVACGLMPPSTPIVFMLSILLVQSCDLGLQRRPGRVHLSEQGGARAAVIEDAVRAGDFLGLRALGAHAQPRFVFRQAAAGDEAGDLLLGRRGHDPDAPAI